MMSRKLAIVLLIAATVLVVAVMVGCPGEEPETTTVEPPDPVMQAPAPDGTPMPPEAGVEPAAPPVDAEVGEATEDEEPAAPEAEETEAEADGGGQ